MVRLIGLSGAMGSGKDAAAYIIKEINPDFQIKRFAGALKVIAEIMTGIPAEEFNRPEVKQMSLGEDWGGMTVRQFLQRLGTDAVRNGLHTNAWVNTLFAGYKAQQWLIPDTRFPNEYDAVKKRDGIVVRIERPGITKGDHPSETALDNHSFDYTIINDGSLVDLRNRVAEMLININLKHYENTQSI
jgi:hypothetical protein